MSQELDYLMAAIDFHLNRRTEPREALGRAIEDYAAVFHQESPEHEESRVSAAIERCLHWDREGE